MMGTVPPHRRGIAAGARVLVQNTGAVISIAFVLAVVTSSVPKNVLFAVFSRPRQPHHERPAGSVHVEHAHRAVVPGRDLAPRGGDLRGAAVARRRPRRRSSGGSAREARTRRWRREHDREPSRCGSARWPSCTGDDAADDPLLRGDRAAPRRERPRPGQAPRLHARPTSSASARSSACATCSASRSTSSSALLDAETARAAAQTRARSTTEDPAEISASSSRRSDTSAPSSSWCACAARRSGSSRRSSWPSGAGSTSGCDLERERADAAVDAGRPPRRAPHPPTRPDDAGVDRRAMAVLSAGHMFTDIAQGSIPALLPFLIARDHLSYAAASALVLAATISSSVIQPLFGYVSDRLSLPWLMPLGPALGGLGRRAGGFAPNYALTFAAVRAQRARRRRLPSRGLAVCQLRLGRAPRERDEPVQRRRQRRLRARTGAGDAAADRVRAARDGVRADPDLADGGGAGPRAAAAEDVPPRPRRRTRAAGRAPRGLGSVRAARRRDRAALVRVLRHGHVHPALLRRTSCTRARRSATPRSRRCCSAARSAR